ncbi:ATP-binding cassette domain-containing protein [Microbacterium sp. PMB16]|uniref:ABC transporter ATP-binding protein n=1 Tax=Microbacterium sp. PMB16 TaxID=3120157 RepID=UPI003F4C5F19
MTPSPDDRTDQVDDSETPPDTTSAKRTPPVKQTSKPRTTTKKAPVKSAPAAKKTATKKPPRAAAEKAAPTGEVVIEPAAKMVIDPQAAGVSARTATSARTAAAKNTAARSSAARATKPATTAAARAASARGGAPTAAAGTAKTPAARNTAAKTAAAKSAAAKSAAAKSTARTATARSTAAKTAAAKTAAAKAAAAKEAAAKAAEEKAAGENAAAERATEAPASVEPTLVREEALTVTDETSAPSAPVVEPDTAENAEAADTSSPDPVDTVEPEPAASQPAVDEPVKDEPDVAEPVADDQVLDDPAVEEPTDDSRTPDEDSDAVADGDDAASDAVGEIEATPSTEAIRIRGLVKQFGDNRAVDGIDLTVPAGSFYGIVGPNGAGKTTTLSIVAGLLRPDEGTVVICGVDQAEKPLAAKRVMGVLPDRLRTFDRLTGRQLLYYYGLLRGLAADVIEKRAADLARAFDLGDALSRVVSDYSAGMTKKIMLAGAMIHSPRVLVLDEPFESVDPVSSAVILDILRAYVSHGGTVILSSHGMDLVERVCSRVAIIVGGEVLAEGTIEEVRAGQTLEARFVELAGSSGEVEGLEWLHTFSD